MAIVTYPLNNISFDAADVAIYNSTRTSGIYAGDDFSASVSGADNSITVSAGIAWMRVSKFSGFAVAMKDAETLDLGLQGANLPRIDAVVLQFDANKNSTSLVVKKGTEVSAPQPPQRETSESLYELHLYHIRRNPGDATVKAANVQDVRPSAEWCGYMADSVTSVDTSIINAQAMALLDDLRRVIADVSSGILPDGAVTSSKIADGAVSQLYTATIGTAWQGEGPYTQTVAVPGITPADTPIIDMLVSDSYDIGKRQISAWSSVYRITTGSGYITVYSSATTDVPVAVQIKVVRK